MIKKLLILISLFLLLASAAYAQKNDFHAYAGNVNLCSCALVAGSITVVNDGVITNGFVLEQSGSAKGFSTLEKTSFVLGPGESMPVKEYFRAPCSTKGDFGLTTHIATDTGLRKSLSQTVSVNACDNVGVKVAGSSAQPCLCEPFRYDFSVENPSDFDDTYSFYPSRFGEYALVSNARAIKAGSSGSFVLILNLPCSLKGSNSFDLIVKAARTGITKKIPLSFGVNDACYANPSNLTAAVPEKKTEKKFDSNVLLNSSVAVLAVMPVLLVLLFLFAALKLAPGKKGIKKTVDIKKLEAPSYRWEGVFREKEKKRKLGNLLFAWIALFAVIIALVSSSAFVLMNAKPGINMTKNMTADLGRNDSGKGFLGFLNLSWVGSGEKNVSRTVLNVSLKSAFTGLKDKFSLPKIELPKKPEIKRPGLNLSLPKLDFLKKKPIERKPFFEKESALNALSAVRSFVITYLYYILAGFVILAIMLFVIVRQEKKEKRSRRKG